MHHVVSSGPVEIAVAVGGLPERGAVLLSHATGFCKEAWSAVIEDLEGVLTIAADQRGHGASTAATPPIDWWDLTGDMLAVVHALAPPRPLVGVGHSMGGATVAMTEIVAPGTFDSLVLIEPILMPGPYERADDHPLTVGALRRRRTFESIDDALDTFRGRGPFARWTEGSLEAYARHGTIEEEDGSRRLACAPELEAEFYRGAGSHGAWERLGEIACPVTVVVGEGSDSHPPDFAAALTARFRNADLVVIPGATHFVPMERPAQVAGVVSCVIAGAG